MFSIPLVNRYFLNPSPNEVDCNISCSHPKSENSLKNAPYLLLKQPAVQCSISVITAAGFTALGSLTSLLAASALNSYGIGTVIFLSGSGLSVLIAIPITTLVWDRLDMLCSKNKEI